MRYCTAPAATARAGMLNESGPEKKSGKIVTTVISIRMEKASEQALGRFNDDPFLFKIDFRHEPVRNHHQVVRPSDFDHDVVRKLVIRLDATDRFPTLIEHRETNEI